MAGFVQGFWEVMTGRKTAVYVEMQTDMTHKLRWWWHRYLPRH